MKQPRAGRADIPGGESKEPPMLTSVIDIRPMDPLKFLTDSPMIKGLAAALFALLTYVLPTASDRNWAAAAFVLVWIDMATALVAVVVSDGAAAIQSSKLRRTLLKLTVYSLAVITVAIASKTIASDTVWKELTVSAVLGIVIVTELKSIAENLGKAGFSPWGKP